MPRAVMVMAVTLISAFLAFLIISNVCFIVCITRCPRLQTAGNFLLVNLAVADLAVGVYGLPTLALIVMLGSTEISISLPEGRIACLVDHFFYACPLSVSQMFLLLASAERYFAIHNPFRHEVIFTKKLVTGMSVGTWLYNVVYHCLPLFGWNQWRRGRPCSLVNFPLTYLFISNLHYCFFLLGIIVMYTRMLLTVHSQTQKIASGIPASTENSASNLPRFGFRAFKAARTTVAIVGCFIILNTPHVVLSAIMAWGWHNGHTPSTFLKQLGGLFSYFMYVNSGINPIIYSLTMRPLRQAMKRLLCSFCRSSGTTPGAPVPSS